MAEFCLHPDKLESMLNEINRHRALTDDEVDMLEALVYRGHRPTGTNFRWKPDHDAALVEASRNRGGIKQFADNHGITLNSGIQRLRRIRATG